jgi:type IV pilus biogenesis/stability protein PilW
MFRRPISLFATLLVSTLVAAGCSTEQKENDERKAYALLQIGTSHLLNGNFPLALKNLLEAEKFGPNDPTIQNNLGMAYYVRRKYEDAEKHFEKAVSLRADYTDARNNLGRLYVDMGAYDKAIEQLTIADNDLTYTTPEKVWTNLGYAYFKKGDYNQAKPILLKAVKARRNDCETVSNYGRTLYELHDYAVAAEALDQAIRLCASSRYEPPHFYSALSYLKLGRKAEAEARFEEIVKLYPDGEYVKKSRELLETIQ